MWAAALDLLFPAACAACGERPVGGAFCADCAALLEEVPAASCARCSGPLPPRASRRRICTACRASPPPYERVAAALLHGGPVADALHRLKYRGRPEIAAPLGRLLAGAYYRELAAVDCIAPIPLHADRRRERGFDQAVSIAREAARVAGRPFEPRALVRVRPTSSQVGQGRIARSMNLEGAFAASSSVAGRAVALIDDVVTTGATAAAASRALRRAGATSVIVLAVSRAH